MCGIAGVVGRFELEEQDRQAVNASLAALIARGPDGLGTYGGPADAAQSRGRLYMGMRRLSIIDLEGGWQPLYNEDRSLALIANGEIYNYVELRSALIARGHRFQTDGDCEVILHLYEECGEALLQQLSGMFAFALWDVGKRCLLLARDRLGEKPLYLYEEDGRLWFTSELRAMLATRRVPVTLDPRSVDDYLHYGWVPEPATMISGLRKLPPGEFIHVDVERWELRQHSYWRVEDVPAVTGDATEAIRSELERIGTQIIRSDVPIGVALSGGFDSSLTAALAARHSPAPVHAFSVGYAGTPGQDERELARALARDLSMPFHSIEIATADFVDDFPQVATLRDDPIADIAGHCYYALSRAARAEGCPVLLQGHGVDELLWGYQWSVQAVVQSMRKRAGHAVSWLEAMVGQLPRGFSRPALSRVAYLVGGLTSGWRTLTPGAHTPAGQLVAYDLSDTYQTGRRGAPGTYTKDFASRLADAGGSRPHALFERANQTATVDIQMIALLCRGYLLQNGLAQGDRLSMANSVELRLPLIDHRLVELLVGLQKTRPAYADSPKQLLREAARGLLPDYVFKRPKRGFNPPVSVWTRALRERYADALCDGALTGTKLLDPGAARRLTPSGNRFGTHNDLFVKYLVLEFWLRGAQAFAECRE
jgi:asparagine synthase (glutamine-hydrolysing)